MNVIGQTCTATLKRPFSRRFFKLGLDTARYTITMEMAEVRQPEKVLWTAADDDASPLLLQCLNSVKFYTFVSLSPAISVSISILHIVRGFFGAGSLRSLIMSNSSKLSRKSRAPAKTEIPGGCCRERERSSSP